MIVRPDTVVKQKQALATSISKYFPTDPLDTVPLVLELVDAEAKASQGFHRQWPLNRAIGFGSYAP